MLSAGTVATGRRWPPTARPTYFEGSTELLNPSTRPNTRSRSCRHLGVKALRVELYWHDVAPSPNSATRPNFEATNPAGYNWGQYDWLLAKAKELDWQVLLTVTSPGAALGDVQPQAPYVTRPTPATSRNS